MKITPLEIKKQEFKAKFRGFDKAEVMAFLELVSVEAEEIVKENIEMKEKLRAANEKLSNYLKIEDALHDTLLATQETADQMRQSADEKANLIVREARIKADRVVESAFEKISALRKEMAAMRSQRAAFLVSFRSLLESQLRLLELMERQAAQEEKSSESGKPIESGIVRQESAETGTRALEDMGVSEGRDGRVESGEQC